MRFPRVLAAVVVASSTVALFAACGDHDHDYDYRAPQADYCSSYYSCGTCTPVAGCGWCTYEDGSGSCASHPDRCREHVFRWNWEPEACMVPDAGSADTTPAGDTATDAPIDAPSSDGPPSADSITNLPDDSASEAGETSKSDATDAPTTCTAPSRATVACVQTTGGTLCASGEYTLACHPDVGGTPVPDASLGCKTVTVSGSPATFYCCPCPTP